MVYFMAIIDLTMTLPIMIICSFKSQIEPLTLSRARFYNIGDSNLLIVGPVHQRKRYTHNQHSR